MKIALKYGLLITLGVALWIIIVHLLVPDTTSRIHTLGAGVFFNVLEIAGIYLGIKAKGRESGGAVTFKEGLKTGVGIAFVYGLSAALFFLGTLAVLGTRLMPAEPGAATQPLWQVVLGAFAGLFIGAVLFGLFYSAVISFILARRLPRED